jgi:hypothetical protein
MRATRSPGHPTITGEPQRNLHASPVAPGKQPLTRSLQRKTAGGSARQAAPADRANQRASQDRDEPLSGVIARQWNSLFSLHLLPGVRVHPDPDPAAAAGAQGGVSQGEAGALAGQAAPGVLAALGQADPVAGPVDYSATLRALQSVPSMADLLATLEELATTTAEFEALHAFGRQSAPDDARLMTAFHVVATIGRGSRDLGDVMELNAHLQELASHEPLAVVQYAARKVAGADMEAEGLMAALQPSDTSGVPAELLAAAPTAVPAGSWQPPGISLFPSTSAMGRIRRSPRATEHFIARKGFSPITRQSQ